MRHHPLAVPQAADREASRLDWAAEVRPRAAVTVPPGHLAVKMANASHGAKPGDIVVLPVEEARALTRSGYAREVLTG